MLSKISDVNPVACVRALRQGWNELLDDYFSRRLTAGKGIRLNRTAAGTVISTIAAGGGGGVAGGGYANYFAVEVAEVSEEYGYPTKIRVFDGADPESLTAGPTDVGDVPAQVINIYVLSDMYVYLELSTLDGELVQNFVVNENPPAEFAALNPEYILIAQVSRDGKVVQRWPGGMIYWRSLFLIGLRDS